MTPRAAANAKDTDAAGLARLRSPVLGPRTSAIPNQSVSTRTIDAPEARFR
jgi:hypothetical protein